MANYLKHVNCENCGSSDGKALYDDGSSFCFVCRKPSKGTISPYLLPRKHSFEACRALPDDCSHEYPEHVLSWVFRFGITIPELMRHNVYYSKQWDQLIFTWKDEEGNTILWQGRNFRKDAKSKCFTSGEPDKILPIYKTSILSPDGGVPGTGKMPGELRLVLVEDPISAIKGSRIATSMPVLGSDLSMDKLKRLSHLPEASGGVVVWLDGNMFHKAQRMAQRLELLGLSARAVYTPLDPKCYTNEEILELLSLPSSLS